MYSHATRGCADEEKYNYSVGLKAGYFKTLLEEVTREFKFGSRINRVPIDFDANDVSQNNRDLFTEYTDLTLSDLLKSSSTTWENGLNVDGSFNHTIDEIETDPEILQL